jgi:hypothetical protein
MQLEDKQHHIKSLYNMTKNKTEEKEEEEAYFNLTNLS